MELTDKREILAGAAKYDASCASSAAPGRSSGGAADYRPASDSTASHLLRRAMAEHPPQQLDLWAQLQAA